MALNPPRDYKAEAIEKYGSGLDQKQKGVLSSAYDEKSILLLGMGGTGKTRIIKSLSQMLTSMMKNVAITSTTGITANEIGGVTIHKASGIGMGDHKSFKDLCNKIQHNRNSAALDFWKTTDVLIIDEVSMLSRKMFEDLNDLAIYFRTNPDEDVTVPFPGMQVILVGDFCQLPPVWKQPDENGTKNKGSFSRGRESDDQLKSRQYCFESPLWEKLFPEKENRVMLKQIYRQTDPEFIDVLNKIRHGAFDNGTLRYISSLNRDFECPQGIEPALLYCKNAGVEEMNNQKLKSIQGDMFEFMAKDIFTDKYPPKEDFFNKNFNAPEKLLIKAGAQVIHLANMPEIGIFNGSIGVVSFIDQSTMTITVKFPVKSSDGSGVALKYVEVKPYDFKIKERDELKFQRRQFPLKLGWALTIHKSQGMNLPYLHVNVADCFATGQFYVALSRAIDPNYLKVIGFDRKKIMADPIVVRFYQKLEEEEEEESESEEESSSEDDEYADAGDAADYESPPQPAKRIKTE